MARSTGILIENLHNHRETKIDPAPMNLFVGDQGHGKSAIISSIELAVSGRCRLERVDGDKLTAEELWSSITFDKKAPDAPARVTVDLVGVEGKKGTLVRTRKSWSLKLEDGTSVNTKEGLAAFFGIRTLDAATAALRSQGFLAMKSEEKIRLLFTALSEPLTAEDLAGNGIDDKEVQQRVLMRSVKSGLALATEKRVGAMRQAEALEIDPPAECTVETLKGKLWVKDLDREKVAKNLEDLDVKRGAIKESLGALRAAKALSGEERLAAAAVKDAEVAGKAAEKAKEALQQILESQEWKEVEGLRKQKSQLQKDYARIQSELVDAKARERMLREGIVAAEENVAFAKGKEGQQDMTCPSCTRSIGRDAYLASAEAVVLAAKAKLEECLAGIRTGESGLGAAKQEGTRLHTVIAAFDARVEERKVAAREAAENFASLTAHAERLQKGAEEARAEAAARPAESEEALTQKDIELVARMDRARNILGAIDTRNRMLAEYEESKKRAAAFREAEKRYAKMEVALDDTGFLAQRVKKPLALLRTAVTTIAADCGQEGLSIEVRDDMTVWSQGRVIESSSRGQQWLVGAILAAALTALTKFGILVLDDLNMVGPRARNKMLQTLRKMAQSAQIEQVFVACVRGESGWCDACGSISAEDEKGCILTREGKRCGARLVPKRPRGAAVGVLRTWEVIDGVATEVLPVGAKVTA